MLFWTLLVTPLVVSPIWALSTCRSLDLELARARRVQAVRGQILSKLQLVTPPEEGEAPDPLPPEVMLLYNSTQELVRMQVGCGEEPAAGSMEEEYYAKELQRVDMTPLGHADNAIPSGSSSAFARPLHFDISALRANLSAGRIRAELRVYKIPNPRARAAQQRLELHQVIRAREPSGPTQRYLASRTLAPSSRAEWVSFDVSETLQQGLSNGERNLGFKLQLHCPCCAYLPAWNTINSHDSEVLETQFAGLDDDLIKEALKGQAQALDLASKAPHLILTLLPHRLNPSSKGRHRRAANSPTCNRNTDEGCCLHPLYINFRKDLKWKWIHQPKGYKANFCAGNCRYIWSTNRHYNMVLPLYHKLNPEASPAPCCVPHKLEPLTILYYVGRLPKVQHLSNMIVKSCRCR